MDSERSVAKPASQPHLEAVDKEKKKWWIARKIAGLFAICLVVLPAVAILVAKRRVPSTLGWAILSSSTTQGTTDIVQVEGKCDISMGRWVRDPIGPIYTGKTCPYHHCQKYGKDPGFLYWRWQPNGCELPRFSPERFLDVVRGKSLAFIGDSLARNQMESLLCLLSQAETPTDAHADASKELQIWSHNFTVMATMSRFLAHAVPAGAVNGSPTGPFDVHLDRLDAIWRSRLPELDYAVISTGNWFYRTNYFWEDGRRVGCTGGCRDANLTDFSMAHAIRRVVRGALEGVAKCRDCKPSLVTFLRTVTLSHFEHGSWFDGGYCKCNRTRPYEEGEVSKESLSWELRRVQSEEVRRVRETSGISKRFGVLDVTKAMTLRPDGHPNWHWPKKSARDPNDCLH